MASAEHRIPRITVKRPSVLKDPFVFVSDSSRYQAVACEVCVEKQGSIMPQGFKRNLPH